jgi:hypothetical protein
LPDGTALFASFARGRFRRRIKRPEAKAEADGEKQKGQHGQADEMHHSEDDIGGEKRERGREENPGFPKAGALRQVLKHESADIQPESEPAKSAKQIPRFSHRSQGISTASEV